MMYLDHAATTTIRPEALAAVASAMEIGNGNASGTHAVARAAKNILEEARERAAGFIGAERPDEIVFTSGGTESDNMAVVGTALASDRRTLSISAIEHKAVIEPARSLQRFGFRAATIPCDNRGVVTAELVRASIDHDAALVSVMAANNEVGSVQPIAEIASVVHSGAPGSIIHTDAVQAFVGGGVDVSSFDVDLLTLSAHKFGGPKGVGLLYVRSGVQLEPLTSGGGQEVGRRPGTSNVAGIAGMVAAMEAATAQRAQFATIVGGERDAFERVVASRLPEATVTAASVERLPHFSHVCVPGVRAESLLIRLDAAGVCAAAGSACQSGAVEPSHVLTAMGMAEARAGTCVRFTMGWNTAPGDGVRAGTVVCDVIDEIREAS